MVPVAVAVMLQTVPCAAEAVNRPEVAFIPAQEDAHVAGMFAVNCCVCPLTVVALAGVMVSGEVTVTVAEALPVPEIGVAVTVQEAFIKGAVNKPAEVMVPQEAAKVALLLAVNCCVAPSLTVGLSGEIVNDEGEETLSYPYTV
jgi:hypothetical protein